MRCCSARTLTSKPNAPPRRHETAVCSQGGWSALMWAAYKGRTPVAQMLLEKGANPNITGQVLDHTPSFKNMYSSVLGLINEVFLPDGKRL